MSKNKDALELRTDKVCTIEDSTKGKRLKTLKWTIEKLQKLVASHSAELVPASWTKSIWWKDFSCRERSEYLTFYYTVANFARHQSILIRSAVTQTVDRWRRSNP